MEKLTFLLLVVFYHFLSALPASESSRKCPIHWIQIKDSCIYVSNKTVSWQDAKNKCQSMNGTLVSVVDKRKNNEVVNVLKNITNGSNSEFYIGLSKQKDKHFSWTDGKHFNFSNWPLPNAANVTLPAGVNTSCVVYDAGFKWRLKTCDTKRRFICQKDFMSSSESRRTCPLDWIPLKDSCIHVSNKTVSWQDAKNKCQSMNGTLVSIGDKRKNDEVVNVLKNITKGSNSEFYIGLSKQKDKDFSWSDGTQFNFSNWRFPNATNVTLPAGVNTSCVVYEADFKWRLKTCDTERRFICQKDFMSSSGHGPRPPVTPTAIPYTKGRSSLPTKRSSPTTPKKGRSSLPTKRSSPTTPKNVNESKSEVLVKGLLSELSNEIKENITIDEILNIVKEAEELGKNLTDEMKKDGNITEPKRIQVKNDQIVIGITFIPSSGNATETFPQDSSKGDIVLSNSVIAVAKGNTSDGVGITSVFLPDVGKENKDVLNSGIISTKFHVPSGTMQNLTDPVVISLPHAKELKGYEKPSCAFIDKSTSEWSTAGCEVFSSNSTFTVCHCSHLTSFAVLLDVHQTHGHIPEKHRFALLVVSIVGCCIALVCFVAALIAFYLIVSERRRRKTETVAIHKNLAIAEILALSFFLLAFGVVDSKEACFAVAFLLHYFLMAVFFWMLIEGLNLHRGLVQVFFTSSRMKVYQVLGWVTPLVFVVCTAAVGQMDYVRDDFCWISHQFIWVFAGPVAVIIFINFVILCIAIRVMIRRPRYKMNQIDDSSKPSFENELRIAFKTTVILLPLLGLTWCLGFLATHSTTANVVIQYLFAIINSLQGLYFFLAHCVHDEDVVTATSNTSTRIKTYISRTLSNSGPSASGSLSTSKRTSAYCNASYEDGRVCETPYFTSIATKKNGSQDSKDSSAVAKASVTVNGQKPTVFSNGTYIEVREPVQVNEKPPRNPQLNNQNIDFDPYYGSESKPTNNQPAKHTEDPKKETDSPNKQFFRRAKSAVVKISSRGNYPRRANSLNEAPGTRNPLSKQTSIESNQSGNSNTPILFSSR